MNAREFFFLVSQMRSAQKHYFKERSQANLRAACKLEMEVDREINRVKHQLYLQEHQEPGDN